MRKLPSFNEKDYKSFVNNNDNIDWNESFEKILAK